MKDEKFIRLTTKEKKEIFERVNRRARKKALLTWGIIGAVSATVVHAVSKYTDIPNEGIAMVASQYPLYCSIAVGGILGIGARCRLTADFQLGHFESEKDFKREKWQMRKKAAPDETTFKRRRAMAFKICQTAKDGVSSGQQLQR